MSSAEHRDKNLRQNVDDEHGVRRPIVRQLVAVMRVGKPTYLLSIRSVLPADEIGVTPRLCDDYLSE